MATFTTQRGLDVTAESAEAVAAIDQFEQNLLHLQPGVERIFSDAEAFPETPMVQAYAATALLYGQDEGSRVAAAPLKRARAASYGATMREIQYLEAVEHFQRNEFLPATDRLEALTVDYPRDLVAAKVCEFLYYARGQHHNGERFLWHMMRLRDANGDDPGFLSLLSFAFELAGRYDDARAAAERALEMMPGQPWAHHTVAHVLIRTGQVAEGRREMERFADYWPECVRGIHSHNAWHRSLFNVEDADWAGAEEILRRDIWGVTPDFVGEITDAIALMWRLDMAGQGPEDLWAEVGPYAAKHAGECLVPFLEGHYLYALGRTGQHELAGEAIAKARARAERDDVEARDVWAPVGAAFAEACAAWGRGDHEHAVAVMAPSAELLPRVGGSDAQDDLFRLAYFDSLAQSGRQREARSYYAAIAPAKSRTAFDELMLAKCG